MEGKKPDSTAMPEYALQEKKTKTFSEKLSIFDEKAGQKIKDMADKVGVIGSIGALVLGFLFWSRADDLLGFLIGLALAGLGIFASFVLMSLLYSYGDIISITIEQSNILKRLEAKKNEEMLRPDVSEEQRQPAADSETADIGAAAGAEPAEPDINGQEAAEDEFGTAELNSAGTKRRNSDLPLEAAAVDRLKRVAHFTERHSAGLICPVCSRFQTSENDMCFHCNCKFVFDDEQPNENGKTA